MNLLFSSTLLRDLKNGKIYIKSDKFSIFLSFITFLCFFMFFKNFHQIINFIIFFSFSINLSFFGIFIEFLNKSDKNSYKLLIFVVWGVISGNKGVVIFCISLESEILQIFWKFNFLKISGEIADCILNCFSGYFISLLLLFYLIIESKSIFKDILFKF